MTKSIAVDESVCQNLLDNLPGVFFRSSSDGFNTLSYVSNGCNELTGFSFEDLCINKIISYFDLLHPDDREWVVNSKITSLQENKNCNIEYKIICRKGKVKWVNEISNGIYSGNELIYIEGYIRDITSEKESSKYNSILSTYQNAINSTSLVSITDIKGKILFANEQFCKYSKYSRSELIGQNHRIVNSKFHPSDFFYEMWKSIRSGDTWRGEIKNLAKDGTFYWVDTVITPIYDFRHKIIQFLSIRNVITEKKEYELALIEKQKELSNAVDEISTRFNKMMQFNYIVSHNLRAPVANILGLANLLQNDEVGEIDKKSLINSIYFSTTKIDEILSDLNLILSSKSESNRTTDQIVVLEIIDNVFISLGLNSEFKEKHFSINIDAESKVILSSKSYFESIFYNLISNSIKYKSPNRNLNVKITITKAVGTLRIVFNDNGIGIDLIKNEKSIFGLYKRFNTQVEGKGLGLHMTKTQVESLGGTINIESELDIGTTFYLTIPVSSGV